MKGATATALLRPALEAAVDVARAGEKADPPLPAPNPLRRYLSFARLPDPALDIARRVLEDDDAFRARVAEATGEDIVGRPGWLFLDRPEGWEAELDRLLQEAAAAEIAAKDERHERGASKRLAGAEAALARAEASARAKASEALSAQHRLQAAQEATDELRAEVERLTAEVRRLGEERGELIRRLKGAESTANQRTSELKAARHELRMVQAELAQVTTGAAGDGGAVALVPGAAGLAAAGADVEDGEGVADGEGVTDGGPAVVPGVDPAAVADAVAAASSAVDELGRALATALRAAGAAEDVRAALGDLAGLLGVEVPARSPAPGDPAAPGSPPPGPAAGGAGAPAGGERRPDRPGRPRRSPVGPPPGVYDDAPEAAEHLVRVPGVLVLVDGYNISHARWHGMPPAEQRTRLLGACEELHARCGADIEVVFDGAGEEPGYRGASHDGVRHRFTPRGVEADDVLLEQVDAQPVTRPVVVVSSDQRVREGARRRGADVLGARQFLGTLRRADPG